jgi:hypothetical protein
MRRACVIAASLFAGGSALAAELIIQPGSEGKDAMVSAAFPTRNYGDYDLLMVNNGSPVRGLVEFEGLSAVPKGATVISAVLTLYNRNNTPNDTFRIYRVTQSWAEMAVTWNGQPAYYPTSYAAKFVEGTGYFRFDIKTLVQEWVDGTYPNYGFIVVRDNEAGSRWPYFISSDYTTEARRPQLTVNYTMASLEPASFGRIKTAFR